MGRRPTELEIANQYLQHEKPPGQVIKELRACQTTRGHCFAADILLSSLFIHRTPPPEQTERLVANARRSYSEAIRQTRNYVDLDDTLRAGLRLAQLRSYQRLLVKGTLPGPDAARNMSTRILQEARLARMTMVSLAQRQPALSEPLETNSGTAQAVEGFLAKMFDGGTPEKRFDTELREYTISEVAGVVGETAVLLLAQRHEMQNNQTETRFPMQSLFHENHGGDCLAKVPGWDINWYGPGLSGASITRADIKGRHSDTNARIGTDDIPIIYISPDLELTDNEHYIAPSIIADCLAEQSAGPLEPTPVVSMNLDLRTARLLSLLDLPAVLEALTPSPQPARNRICI